MRLAVLGSLLALFGCVRAAPPYDFVQKGATNPLAQAAKVLVRAPSFAPNFTVNNDPETAFIADLDAQQKTDWPALKASLATHVKEGVSAVGAQKPLEVGDAQPGAEDRVIELEMRSVDWNYCIWTGTVKDGAGATLEVIRLSTSTKRSMADMTVWQGLPSCSWSIGALITRYVNSRASES